MTHEFAGAAERVLSELRRRKQTLSVAESLTGGLLGGAITEIPGASDVFLGGVVAYNARMKSELLGVDPESIAHYGVVSREIAIEMAVGAARLFRSDWAIATTGVAGPGPSEGVAAGTVWIAIAATGTPYAEALALSGSRQEVRMATIARALATFTRILSE